MVSGPEDEFANFLDFGELNFPSFDPLPQTEAELQNGAGAMDTSMEGAGMLGLEQAQMQNQMGQSNHHTPMNGFHGSSESFPDLMQSEIFEQQQQQQQQQLHMQHQRYHGQNVVPPTPNSMELHGAHTQYYRAPADHQQLHMYDQYRRPKDQVCALYGWAGQVRY